MNLRTHNLWICRAYCTLLCGWQWPFCQDPSHFLKPLNHPSSIWHLAGRNNEELSLWLIDICPKCSTASSTLVLELAKDAFQFISQGAQLETGKHSLFGVPAICAEKFLFTVLQLLIPVLSFHPLAFLWVPFFFHKPIYHQLLPSLTGIPIHFDKQNILKLSFMCFFAHHNSIPVQN